jgi:hypothetical protein
LSEGETAPSQTGRKKRIWVLHPLLFAAFPVLALWAGNVREGVGLLDVLLPLLAVMAAAAVLFWVGTLIFHSAGKAGLAVSALVLLFFTYGRMYSWAAGRTVAGLDIGRHAVLLPLWAGLAVLALYLSARARWIPEFTQIFNVVAAGLVIVNVWSVISYDVRARADEHEAARLSELGFQGTLPDPGTLASKPDIYYLVFEEYAGEQVLQRVFDWDNRPFLRALEQRGFYVAHQSTDNYPRTSLSLASSLNMEYLDFLTKDFGRSSDDARPLTRLIEYNRVGKFLQSAGYRYTQVGSWWGPTARSPIADQNIRFGGPSEFARALTDTTVIQPFSEDSFRLREWKRVQFQFKALAGTKTFASPKFVFGHLLVPHAPYVFNPDGSYLGQGTAAGRTVKENYVNQLRYVNSQILGLVDQLMDRPVGERPVIIVQADEGPYEGEPTSWLPQPSGTLTRKFHILNAIYLPEEGNGGLTPTITPVNTFRVVFDRYFDADLPMLPDRNFVFRSLGRLYDFTDVTTLVRASFQPARPPAA